MKAMSDPVRLAVSADTEALVQLVREYCIEDGHEFVESRVRTALAPLLQDDRHGVIWVIGEPPLGYAAVTWGFSLESGGRDALLDEVYLRERGRGLGTQLLQCIIDDLVARGMNRVFLETEAPNEQARRFYARYGFATEDSIWMSRSLAPPED